MCDRNHYDLNIPNEEIQVQENSKLSVKRSLKRLPNITKIWSQTAGQSEEWLQTSRLSLKQ